jgi:cytochrome c peroxidase
MMKLNIATIFSFLLVIILLSSYSTVREEIKPTPYFFEYDTLRFFKPIVPENNPTTFEGIALGRLLFYDPILSYNNTISCGSCHKQEYAFSDGGKKFSSGIDGKIGKRNSMSLINLAWQTSFFWDGRAKSLEDVIFFPVTDSLEMGNDTNNVVKTLKAHNHYPVFFDRAFPNESITFDNVSKAISQFIRTIHIRTYNKDFFRMIQKVKSNESNKKLLKGKSFAGMYFRTINTCGRCHPGEGAGDTKFADNLITKNDTNSRYFVTGDIIDISNFKVPSLINIKSSAPYMHDGRFKSINEVIEHYDEHLKEIAEKNSSVFGHVEQSTLVLSKYDTKNFDKFFDLFTDSTLLTSKNYSNPFLSEKFDWKDFPVFK